MAQSDPFDNGGPEDFFQLVIEQLEELTVTILEGIRERPGVFAAILAGIAGAFIGIVVAGARARKPPKPTSPKGLVRMVSSMADALELEDRARDLGKSGRRVAKQASKTTSKQSDKLTDAVKDVRWAAALVPVVTKLAENPLVREMVMSTVRKQVKKRFSR